MENWNVCPNQHLLLLFEQLSQKLVWLISALCGVSLRGALQEFKCCQDLKEQEDVQSSSGYSAETVVGTKNATSVFRS